MKILFLTDNFPPESNAPAIRTHEHCREWVSQGAEVTVISCFPNFPQGALHKGYKNKLYSKEMIDGIQVIRVWSFITPNRGLYLRSLDYLSYSVTSFIASLFVKADVIVATSPQLFTALSGSWASFFKRTPWVMEIRDLWPESIKAVEVMETPTVLKVLYRLSNLLYKSADRITVVTHSFKERLITYGQPDYKIDVVTNGVILNQFDKNHTALNLKKELGLEGKYIVSYIGTHGMAHKLDFILDAITDLDLPDVHFLFVGDGAMKTRLQSQAEKLGLQNITLHDPVPKERVIDFLAITDVSLINLRKKVTFTKVIPSKIFENAAMGKPILLGVAGEAASIIEKYRAGLVFEPENKVQFVHQLRRLYTDKSLYSECQEGCEKLAMSYDRKKLANKMLSILSTHFDKKKKVTPMRATISQDA